jgi:uncharacterized membrane protein YdjX (TVP38/TMEM64 family)
MKDLIKIAVILALAFASTFIIIKSTGLITEEGVSAFLQQSKSINPWWLATLVVGLLLIDLLIAVPTMTTILFAGFLMGPIYGGLASATGLMLLGVLGYGMGYRIGRPVLLRLFKDEKRLQRLNRPLRAMICYCCLCVRPCQFCPNSAAHLPELRAPASRVFYLVTL